MSACASQRAVAAAGMADLYEPDAVLRPASGKQKLSAEFVGFFRTDTVQLTHVVGFC